MTARVRFARSGHAPIDLAVGAGLAEVLDVHNSPVLFGCRTGVCGTCLSEVSGDLVPPDADEQEVLDIHAPGNPRARLLCQVRFGHELVVERYLG